MIILSSRLLNASFYMAFRYCFSFATVLAANFGNDRFRIMTAIVFKLMRTASAMLTTILSGLSGLIGNWVDAHFWISCFSQDLIRKHPGDFSIRINSEDFFLCLIFTQRLIQ